MRGRRNIQRTLYSLATALVVLGVGVPVLPVSASSGAPGSFSLLSPANGATGVSATPTLSWTASSDVSRYDIAISGDPGNPGDVLIDSVPAGTTIYFENAVTLSVNTTYYWQITATNGSGSTTSEMRSFTTTSAPNQIPDNPTGAGPDSLLGSGTVDPTTLLKTPITFTLHDNDSGDRVRYQLVISTIGNPTSDPIISYVSPLQPQGGASFQYGQAAGDGTYLVGSATTHLVDGDLYYVFIRTLDEHGAASNDWPQVGSFAYSATPTTEDTSGTTLAVEDSAPNSGDANNDGFPDSWQSNVSSFIDPVTNKYAVLETQGCGTNNAVGITAEPNGAQADTYSYPAGLMNFTIACATPGATATVTQYFYGLSGTHIVARKYNATTHTYTTITGAVISSVTIGGQQATKITYTITDGGPLDQDGVANGTIVDPTGPALLPDAPNTGLKPTSLISFVCCGGAGLLLIGLSAARRRSPF